MRSAIKRRALVIGEILEARCVLDSTVVFNELFYHPLDTTDGDAVEWIELYNQNGVDVELSHWTLDGGVRYEFPAGTILPGQQRLVIASDPIRLQQQTGLESVFGPFEGNLSNGGELVELRSHTKRIMDQVRYDDQTPWPLAADGTGLTLAKRFEDRDSASAHNWTVSAQPNGTPGQPNFSATSDTFESLVDATTSLQYSVIATDDGLANTWTLPNFDAVNWPQAATNQIGYDVTGFGPATLVRHYSLDQNLQDSTGLGPIGQTNEATFTAEHSPALGSAGSLSFDGSNDEVVIPDAETSDAYTMSVWVKPDRITGQGIVFRSAVSPLLFWSHALRMTADGYLEAYAVDGGGTSVKGTTQATAGQWYHLATSASADGMLRLFVNGVEEGQAQPITRVTDTGTEWRLGSALGDGSGNGPFGFLDGQIADFAVWHEVLSNQQIAGLASGIAPRNVQGISHLIRQDVADSMHQVNSSVRIRHEFDLPAGRFYDQLALEISYDDGFIAYLNGSEIARRNAPSSAAWNATATAERTGQESVEPEVIDVSAYASQLRLGTNVLAIHGLNASAGDTDFLLEASLTARVASASSLPDIRINELPSADDANFWVELINLDSDTVDLAGYSLVSDGNLYTFDAPTPMQPNEIKLVSAESLGFRANSDQIVSLFTPFQTTAVDAQRLADRSMGLSLTNQGAEQADLRWQFPDRPTPGVPNAFTTESDIVINEIMYHRQPQYAQESFASEPTPQALLPVNSAWRYRESAAALTDDWFANSHPAGTDQWQTGAGPIGFQADVPEIATKLTVPLLLPQPITTYYFETDFEFAGAERSFDLLLDYLVDDGAIFYLNGQEVLRINMPDSADSTTFASSSVDIPTWVTGVTLPQDLLQIGTNRLSVEVHQATAVEHDIVMGASLAILEDPDPDACPIAYQKSDEEWIELFNRSDRAIDISGWQLAEAIGYTFPDNTLLNAGDFVVVANQPNSLAELHNLDPSQVFGPFGGSLADSDERLILNDANGNLADQVHYYDGGRWPAYSDGGGSSLELRNPLADNAVAEMWAASNEADRSEWYRLQYTTTVEAFPYDTQPNFQELVVGLIDSGELLIDNVSVIEDPQGEANELIQNGSFETDAINGGAAAWRLIGNHGQSYVTVDPLDPNNQVLHVIAESHMHYLSNHLETTLANRARVTNGQTYTISMDVKWLAGSPQFHTELYHKDAARTTILPQPAQAGTPGRQNSAWQPNTGPAIDTLRHSPAIPSSNDSVTIQAFVADADGLAKVDLLYRVDEGSFQRTAMTATDRPGFFSAQIPPQDNRSVVQFYVEADDALSQASVFPAAGPESGAMYRVLDGFELDELRHSVHVIMQPEDVDNIFAATNMMDNDRHAATVIYDADEIYYDVGARLKGSMFTRNSRSTAGFNLRFSPEQKFRGVHEVITFDQKNEKELQVRHLINAAGIYGMYDDVVSFMPPHQPRALPTLMSMARYDSEFVESQFSGRAAEGTVFKLEGIRVLQSTVDGNKESLKIYQPIGWIQAFDIADLGDSKERYRWPILISGNRDEDNFEPVVRMGQTFSLNGDELENAIEDAIDVDQWLRVFAMMSVTGIADVYGQAEENPHNLSFYYDPEADKMLALPWDWDFAFQIAASSPLTGRGKNFHKVMRIPKYERQFYGHLLDIVDTVGNSAYFDRWADHYGTMLRESFRSSGSYLDARGSSIRTQIERDFARIDFQITPLDSSTVDAASVELQGQGWVDIREIRLAGTDSPLPVEWSVGDGRNADQWHVHLPLAPGLNHFTLEAYGYQGQLMASQTVEVTSTVARRPVQDALRISEINYNPHVALTQFGEAAVDNDEFEFIEFTNIGSEAIDLAGVKLIRADVDGDVEGVEFAFGSQQLLPNQRIVVVQNRTAFQSRYGNDVVLAVGSGPGTADGEFAGRLGNDGETLTLVDADGAIVQQVRYNDSSEWPVRADGRASSLVWRGEAFDVNSPSAWSNSQRFGGSPGSDADQFEPTVVINEILSNSGDTGNDRVELVNRSGQSVDITTWYLSDTADDYLKFAMATLPAGVTTVLDAGAYWVIDQRTLGFGLRSQTADDLYLVEADTSGRPIRFADFVEIPPMDLNDSFGRWPDGTGPFVVQKSSSFGSPNIGPAAEFSGDFNGDQTVDATDIQLLSAAIQTHSPDLEFDLNQDQATDFMDLVMLVQQIIGSPMGDVNLDGRFNSSDLVLVFQASEFEDNIVGNSTWSTGDWNADGEFTTQDLVVVFQFGGYQNF